MEHLNFYKIVYFENLEEELQSFILKEIYNNNIKLEIQELLCWDVDYSELYQPNIVDKYFIELGYSHQNIFIKF